MAEGRSITGTHEVGRATYIGAALEVDPEGNHETVTGPRISPGQVPEIPGLNPDPDGPKREKAGPTVGETSWPFKRL